LYALAGLAQYIFFIYGDDVELGGFVVRSVDTNNDILTEPESTGIIKLNRVSLVARDVFSQSHDLFAFATKWSLPIVKNRQSFPSAVTLHHVVNVLLWGFKIMYVD
jgi:hypothetical protein